MFLCGHFGDKAIVVADFTWNLGHIWKLGVLRNMTSWLLTKSIPNSILPRVSFYKAVADFFLRALTVFCDSLSTSWGALSFCLLTRGILPTFLLLYSSPGCVLGPVTAAMLGCPSPPSLLMGLHVGTHCQLRMLLSLATTQSPDSYEIPPSVALAAFQLRHWPR